MLPPGKATHAYESVDCRSYVPCSQVVEVDIGVKELAGVKVSIDGSIGFAPHILFEPDLGLC